MEKLTNEFTVQRPIEDAWAVLTDLERIAPCMPGAELTEIEGDVYRGLVKVKLGAIATNFKGQATFVDRDDAAHTATLKAEGRDVAGKGMANATITASLTSTSPQSATCKVDTELHVSGKVATFGRGIMADVSKRLMAQFAANLNEMLDQPASAHQAQPDAPDANPVEPNATPKTAPDAASTVAPDATPTVRMVNGPAAEPIDMTDVAGSAVLKRLLPAVGGLAILVMLWRRLRHR